MLSNKELNQLIQVVLNEENTNISFEFGYIGVQEYDLKLVSRDLELTSEQIKALQEYGSNFIMITEEDSFCKSSAWQSWVHDPSTDFVYGLHSVDESNFEAVRENKPFQICFNDEWMGTLPYSKELEQALYLAGVNKSWSLRQQERCIEYVAQHVSSSVSKETKNKVYEMYEMFKAMEENA